MSVAQDNTEDGSRILELGEGRILGPGYGLEPDGCGRLPGGLGAQERRAGCGHYFSDMALN